MCELWCRVIFDKSGVARLHQVLVSDDVSSPDGLAFDWIHHNLYWTDAGKDRIDVLGLRNAVGTLAEDGATWRRTLIDSGLDEPRAIVVDPRPKYRYLHALLMLLAIKHLFDIASHTADYVNH